MSTDSEQTPEDSFNLDDWFLAPWGLANEKRPVHFTWEGPIENFQIGFAKPVEIIAFYNTKQDHKAYEDPSLGDDGILTFEIPEEEFEVPGYFSAEFIIPETYDEVMVGQLVASVFNLPDGKEATFDDYTFTIRPQLECGGHDESISLSEGDEEITLEVDMKYVGFGKAEVEIIGEAEGEIISEGESVYQDLVDAIIESGIHRKDSDHFEIEEYEEWRSESNFEEEGLNEFIEEFRDALRSSEQFEDYDEEEINTIIKILESDDESESDASEIYKHIEMLLVNSILDIVDRNPSENVQLEAAQTILEIDSKLRQIELRYELQDSQGNEYDPVVVPIEVEDHRDENTVVQGEVKTNWENIELDPDEERERAIERVEDING